MILQTNKTTQRNPQICVDAAKHAVKLKPRFSAVFEQSARKTRLFNLNNLAAQSKTNLGRNLR